MTNMITSSLSSGEFSKNTEAAILDSVKILKKKSLEKQRDKINERIRQFVCVTAEDYEMLNNLLKEKMTLDQRLKN